MWKGNLHGNCVACPRSIILAVVITRSRLYIFSSTSFPMPIRTYRTYPELPISRNFTVCKAVRLAAFEGAPEFCLTFLRNSIPSSTLTHPSFTVFSPSLQADIMLTSLRPSIFRVARRSHWSTSYSLSFFLSFFSYASSSSLVNAYETRSCTSRDESSSNCQNVTNPLFPREPRREGYQNTTRFRPSQRELLSSKPILADNLFLSGLQSTRVPHE